MKTLFIVWLLLGEVPHTAPGPPGAFRVAVAYASQRACLSALKLWRGLDGAVCYAATVRGRPR